MTQASHPFTLYSASALRRASGVLEKFLQLWAGDWLGSDEPVVAGVEAAGKSIDIATLSELDWHAFGHGESELAFATGPGFAGELAAAKGWSATRSRNDESRLWKDAVQGAVQSLAHGMLGLAAPQFKEESAHAARAMAVPLPPAWFARGSGYLVARLSLGACHVHAIFSPGLASALTGPKASPRAGAAVLSRMDAVKAQRVGVNVVARTMEVSLGEIQNLARGHVILLRSAQDQAFDLVNEHGAFIGKGYLADVDGCKAVQLAQGE